MLSLTLNIRPHPVWLLLGCCAAWLGSVASLDYLSSPHLASFGFAFSLMGVGVVIAYVTLRFRGLHLH